MKSKTDIWKLDTFFCWANQNTWNAYKIFSLHFKSAQSTLACSGVWWHSFSCCLLVARRPLHGLRDHSSTQEGPLPRRLPSGASDGGLQRQPLDAVALEVSFGPGKSSKNRSVIQEFVVPFSKSKLKRNDTSTCHSWFHFHQKKIFFWKRDTSICHYLFCCSIILSHWGKHSWIQLTDDPATEWLKQLYKDGFVKINSTDLLKCGEHLCSKTSESKNLS